MALVGTTFTGPMNNSGPAPMDCLDGATVIRNAEKVSCLYYMQLQTGILMYAVPGDIWQYVASPRAHEVSRFQLVSTIGCAAR